MNIVPTTSTPINAQGAFDAFVSAWRDATATMPSRQTASLLLALMWVETARGNAMHNFNPGNLTASPNYSGNAWRPSWFELTPSSSARDVSLHNLMLQNKAPSAFRAYDSLTKGFADWVHSLLTTFPNVVTAAKSGNPDAFRVELSKHYSTDYANPTVTKTFASIQQEFMPLTIAGGLADEPPLVSTLPEEPHSSPSRFFSGPCALPVLVPGDRGQAVALWQMFVGMSAINGIYDSGTLDATRAFQSLHNLVPDGKVGPITWGKLLP